MSLKKLCKMCDKEKTLDKYGSDKSARWGVSRYCAECMPEHNRRNREKYAHKAKESQALYYQKNKEKINLQVTAYQKANTNNCVAKKNARKALSRAVGFGRACSWADPVAILDVYIEATIVSREAGIRYEVDHILPLNGVNVSGLHHESNLQILTQIENGKKGNTYQVQ